MVDLPESWRFFRFSGGTGVRNLPAHAGDARDLGLIPGSSRSFGVGNGNPLCHKEADTTEHTQATLGASKLVVTQLQSSQRCSPSISSASSVATHIGSGARVPPVKPHPNSTSYICSNAISKRDDILRYCGLELHHTNLGRIKFNP